MKNYKVPAHLKEYVESILITTYSQYTMSEQVDENNEYSLRYKGGKTAFKMVMGRAKCLHKSDLSKDPNVFYVTPDELHDAIFLKQARTENPNASITIYEDEEEVFED